MKGESQCGLQFLGGCHKWPPSAEGARRRGRAGKGQQPWRGWQGCDQPPWLGCHPPCAWLPGTREQCIMLSLYPIKTPSIVESQIHKRFPNFVGDVGQEQQSVVTFLHMCVFLMARESGFPTFWLVKGRLQMLLCSSWTKR